MPVDTLAKAKHPRVKNMAQIQPYRAVFRSPSSQQMALVVIIYAFAETVFAVVFHSIDLCYYVLEYTGSLLSRSLK